MNSSLFRAMLSIACCILSLSWVVKPIHAQNLQKSYQRKSISYLNAILTASPDFKLTAAQEAAIFDAVRGEIELARFDFIPLPEGMVASFKSCFARVRPSDLDELAEVINETLAPEILHLVDVEKEMRALDLVTESERASYIVQKTRETGITAEHLEAIMNSAYVYVFVITDLQVQSEGDSGRINVDLEAGLIWYGIKTNETGHKVELLAKKRSAGSASANQTESYDYYDRTIPGSEYAFAAAAENMAIDFKIATQRLPDFQLVNPLGNTGSGWVEFSMGKREGVNRDDEFIILEFVEKLDGSIREQKRGMVRVVRVGDYREQRTNSKARTIIGNGFERGMLAVEHPRLPVDLSFRFATLPIAVDSGTISTGGYQGIHFSEDVSSSIRVGQIMINYNMASFTNWSQFFTSFYLEAGRGKLPGGTIYGDEIPTGIYWSLGGGLVKKYHLNRLYLGLETLLTLAEYRINNTGYSHGNCRFNSLGMTFNMNLEMAVLYDWNIGGGFTYRLILPHTYWSFLTAAGAEEGTKLDLQGWGYQVYLTWSLPSMGMLR
ncbi:MAG: hypothetical protein ABH878_10520 [bacterium]